MGICLSLEQQPEVQPRPQVLVSNDIPDTPPIPAKASHVEHAVFKKRLSQVDPAEISDVPNKDLITRVRVIDVHDGDTIKVLFEFGGEIMKISLRILGVDTPELTAGHARLPEEKAAGIKARDFVRETLHRAELQGGVHAKFISWDKYGSRIVADILLSEKISLTDLLLKQGYAHPYNGEKKKEWTKEELTSPPFV